MSSIIKMFISIIILIFFYFSIILYPINVNGINCEIDVEKDNIVGLNFDKIPILLEEKYIVNEYDNKFIIIPRNDNNIKITVINNTYTSTLNFYSTLSSEVKVIDQFVIITGSSYENQQKEILRNSLSKLFYI